MANAVKIRELFAPSGELGVFDPGAFVASLEFYETDEPVTEDDRDGLAQFLHFLAFIALRAQSTNWDGSIIPQTSLAFRAIESHFSHLKGWAALVQDPAGVPYRNVAAFLLTFYPPRPPE